MKQVRFVPIEACNLQVREPQEGEQESREIVGMPIVYGVRSVNLTPWSKDREVYEVLEAGFITPELLKRSDVVLNLNHSNKVTDILGRYRNSERDTLSLELAKNGVTCRCDLPHTNNANDTLELMRRGDITGMSFAFNDNPRDKNSVRFELTDERSADGTKEVWIRRVRMAVGLYDVAIVTHPAYEMTSVTTREFGEEILRQIDEQIEMQKREQETDEERKAREERETNGGETNAEKEAREAREREANGGETDAEKKAREEEEEELERKAREAKAVMRMRLNLLNLETEDLDF